jgi:hypothetical protein
MPYSTDSTKHKLIEFLERRAFDPVLKAKPEHYPEPRRGKLVDVQRRARAEAERFHRYGSAREVVVNFLRDLDSEPGERLHRELKALGLPALNDIEDEFMKLADDLHVNALEVD